MVFRAWNSAPACGDVPFAVPIIDKLLIKTPDTLAIIIMQK